MPSEMAMVPSQKVMIRIPQKAVPVAIQRNTVSFSLKIQVASRDVMMGDSDMMIQLVVGFSLEKPVLNAMRYSKYRIFLTV